MMDWTKQTEEMTKVWIDTQKKMWDNWLGTTQHFEKTQAAEFWAKTLNMWEESVKNTLNAQAEWTRTWADSIKSIEGAPKEVGDWAQQAHEMSKQWAEAQKQLWDSWFAVVKKFDPSKAAPDWSEEGQKMYKTWQETSQKVMNAQAEWARQSSVMPAEAKVKDKK